MPVLTRNKNFDRPDYIECNRIGCEKVTRFLYALGFSEVYPEPDEHAHNDLVAIQDDYSHPFLIEVGVRKLHYMDVWLGRFKDVRAPKRKFYYDSDGPTETLFVPHLLIETPKSSLELYYVVADDVIREGIPYVYDDWNADEEKYEPFVPFKKNGVWRASLLNGILRDEGFVSDRARPGILCEITA